MENIYKATISSVIQIGTSHLWTGFSCRFPLIDSATSMPPNIFCAIKWLPEPHYAVNSLVPRKFKTELLTETTVRKTHAVTTVCKKTGLCPPFHTRIAMQWSNSHTVCMLHHNHAWLQESYERQFQLSKEMWWSPCIPWLTNTDFIHILMR